MERLHIVTPVSRPENLQTIWSNIRKELSTIVWCWWVILDLRKCGPEIEFGGTGMNISGCGRGGLAGHCCRNTVLDHINDGLIYCLDDDNLIHPGLAEAVRQMPDDSPAMLLPQAFADGKVRIEPNSKTIDTGSILVRASMRNGRYFRETAYDGDQYYCLPFADTLGTIRY